jgi:hypothetical protein
MSFFFNSAAGAADFAALLFACAVGFVFGARHIKAMAGVALAAFFFDRLALHMFGATAWLSLVASLGCLAAAGFVVGNFPLRIARAFALLYVFKMAAYTALVAGLISFGTMATWATVFAYGQLLLILGGAADGNSGGRISNLSRNVGLRAVSGFHHLLAAVAGGRAISRRSDVSGEGLEGGSSRVPGNSGPQS